MTANKYTLTLSSASPILPSVSWMCRPLPEVPRGDFCLRSRTPGRQQPPTLSASQYKSTQNLSPTDGPVDYSFVWIITSRVRLGRDKCQLVMCWWSYVSSQCLYTAIWKSFVTHKGHVTAVWPKNTGAKCHNLRDKLFTVGHSLTFLQRVFGFGSKCL